MIAMTLSPADDPSDRHILEIKITAPASQEPTPIPVEKVPTLIYIDDSVEGDLLPSITHALTDTVNRITWSDQIQLLSSNHKLPNHLTHEPIAKEAVFNKAQELGHCKLVVISNENSKEFNQKIAISSEFLTETHVIKPTTTIELVDNLNDYIKDLKQKTIVNLKIEIELPTDRDTLEPINYIPNLTKGGNTYFANLIDLASEEERAYAFIVEGASQYISYSYDDIVISRLIRGGQRLTL